MIEKIQDKWNDGWATGFGDTMLYLCVGCLIVLTEAIADYLRTR